MNFIALNAILKSERVRSWYRRLFSVAEIEQSTTVQWFFGAMLLFFYATFYQWVNFSSLSTASADNYLCWPYFQGCKSLLFFTNLPYGYTQTIFYAGIFCVMLLIVYCMWRKSWTSAHALMLLLWIWKMVAGFALNYGIVGMYDYYHLILTATLLFLPFKEYFAKAVFVVLYFLSGALKIYPAWTLGTYFTSLQTGLPLFPDSLTPLITNSVLFGQIVGCWFLMSKNWTLQRVAFAYFTIFHIYSTILVGYNYPTIALPAEIILFGPLYRYQRPPHTLGAIAGWVFIVLLMLFQFPAYLISGDQKMTLEGYRFGMWMFDSNHQCTYTIVAHYPAQGPDIKARDRSTDPGTLCPSLDCITEDHTSKKDGAWTRTIRYESPNAWSRCSPYPILMRAQAFCDQAKTVALTLDHSINGGLFFRTVDESDVCGLSYKAWGHNIWIKEPPVAPAVGYPVKNYYTGYRL